MRLVEIAEGLLVNPETVVMVKKGFEDSEGNVEVTVFLLDDNFFVSDYSYEITRKLLEGEK